MRNPLPPLVRFALYVTGIVLAVVTTWVQTRDVVATLAATQVAVATLGASRVTFDRDDTGRR